MKLSELREDYEKQKVGYEEQIKWLSEQGTRFFRAEGSEPMVDITDDMIAEYKGNVTMYERLIKSLDNELADRA